MFRFPVSAAQIGVERAPRLRTHLAWCCRSGSSCRRPTSGRGLTWTYCSPLPRIGCGAEREIEAENAAWASSFHRHGSARRHTVGTDIGRNPGTDRLPSGRATLPDIHLGFRTAHADNRNHHGVALPTDDANHGGSTACAAGADARASTAAHSTTSNRRTRRPSSTRGLSLTSRFGHDRVAAFERVHS